MERRYNIKKLKSTGRGIYELSQRGWGYGENTFSSAKMVVPPRDYHGGGRFCRRAWKFFKIPGQGGGQRRRGIHDSLFYLSSAPGDSPYVDRMDPGTLRRRLWPRDSAGNFSQHMAEEPFHQILRRHRHLWTSGHFHLLHLHRILDSRVQFFCARRKIQRLKRPGRYEKFFKRLPR